MQRVLSFQMARGFGESSEFVTKRMCFSFLFSVGFLCLLCGFLIGRFAAGRAVDIRAEKTRLQLAGNGLESNEHLRENLIERIGENSFDNSYITTDPADQEDAKRIKKFLLDLQFFHGVVENRSCIAATVRGYHEPDRYIILSGSGQGIIVVMELAKILKSLNEDFDWKPRRTITFMICLEASEACHVFIPNHVRDNVVAYIELNVQSIEENGYFVTSGSDIVQSSILGAGDGVKNPNEKNHDGANPTIIKVAACPKIICPGSIPRLRLDVPNAAVTFVSGKNSSSQQESNKKIVTAYFQAIAQIIGTSVWRLSEMTLLKWDPRNDNRDAIEILESMILKKDYRKNVDTLVTEIDKMARNIAIFNDKMENMETTKSLQVRMANDLSMRVRRVILCNDDDLEPRTDWLALRQVIKNNSTSNIDNYLDELLICYQTANQLLQEDVT